jgi:uncharacterized membrane protein
VAKEEGLRYFALIRLFNGSAFAYTSGHEAIFPVTFPLVIARGIFRGLVALFFLAAGANHFRTPNIYLRMMPAWVPWPDLLNMLAGAAEMLGGLGLLFTATRRPAGWWLIALLVAVFPANVHVALQGHMPGFDFSPLTLWLRLPFQAVFIAAVWWVALKREKIRT